jgi:chromosome segregation ATPase
MVQIIKTFVKCYKKKAKKMVGGKQKVYEYNQYLIPIKRTDNLQCKEGVLIIPEKYFKELFGVQDTWAVKEYISKLKGYERNVGEYRKEFKDLEWKHNELSKSYKELLNKHTKANKKYRVDISKIQELESENAELKSKLELKKEENKKLIKNYEEEIKKEKIIENEIKPDKDKDLSKDKDFWTIIKSKIGKKDLIAKEDE